MSHAHDRPARSGRSARIHWPPGPPAPRPHRPHRPTHGGVPRGRCAPEGDVQLQPCADDRLGPAGRGGVWRCLIHPPRPQPLADRPAPVGDGDGRARAVRAAVLRGQRAGAGGGAGGPRRGAGRSVALVGDVRGVPGAVGRRERRRGADDGESRPFRRGFSGASIRLGDRLNDEDFPVAWGVGWRAVTLASGR